MDAQTGGALAPHVVVQVGAARIGIPAGCVERALAAPEHYTPLPRRQGALLGMLAVDGVPVPVIDLACWVALAGAVTGGAPSHRRVVLLRAGDRMAALQVDVLEPLAALPASAVQRLCHDDDPEQLFHSAAIVPASGEMLALLEVDHLFDLARSWCAAAGIDVAAVDEDAAGTGQATHSWAVVEAGGELLALRADDVAEVTPMPEHVAFPGGPGVALCTWRDSHLAVLSLARLLGADAARAAPLLAVLRRGEQALGLPIQSVRELRQMPVAPQGVRADAPGRLPCLTVSHDNGETLRLVDTAALFAMHPEASLNLAMQPAAGGGARRNDDTYVVLDAGGKLALPISACEEVLHAAAEDCVPAPAGGATLNWRGATIAVHDLRQPVGGAMRRGKVSLVVLRGEAQPVAVAVDQILSMITPGSAELTCMRRGGESVELLILEEESGSSTYCVADPAALLRRSAASV
ncbi:chemotaxis signal transduction protein [Duganella sp. 1224]|uniref:chemotaxis protein CheW n=1 Tax=Duganella sp. 1224 TaxID=2587052 RepID=UPI0015CB68F0|nr:chemotaxis protein CheW [Duganella sp. 1224]NYE63771.1 chemotaxis signal transduction protein [Duganella sp. 1224]